jgi:hypothetical protein
MHCACEARDINNCFEVFGEFDDQVWHDNDSARIKTLNALTILLAIASICKRKNAGTAGGFRMPIRKARSPPERSYNTLTSLLR